MSGQELNDGHYPELVDRAWIVEDMWDRLVLEHPVVLEHRALWVLAVEIRTKLSDFYQAAGAVQHGQTTGAIVVNLPGAL